MKPPIFVLLMCICIQSFGAIIMIRGLPSPLEYKDDLYHWPLNIVFSPRTTNLFITMDGTNKVCFLNTAPSGVLEQTSEISVIINGLKTNWNCFPYRTTIYEVRP